MERTGIGGARVGGAGRKGARKGDIGVAMDKVGKGTW